MSEPDYPYPRKPIESKQPPKKSIPKPPYQSPDLPPGTPPNLPPAKTNRETKRSAKKPK